MLDLSWTDDGVTPYTLLTVLPFGAHYVANGTLAISDFVILHYFITWNRWTVDHSGFLYR